MISSRDTELYRQDVRARGAALSASDRENILRSYLPDPSALHRPPTLRRKKTTGRKSKKTTPVRTFIKSQIHLLVHTLIHILFGIYVRLVQSYRAVVDRILAILFYHHRTPELIQKDVKGLSRIPEHLSVVLTLRKEDDALEALMDDVAELAAWSACAGIPTLSIYEKSGILKSYIPTLHQIVTSKLSAYYGSPAHQPTLRLFAPHHSIYSPPQPHGAVKKSNPATLTMLLLSAPDGRETLVDLTKTLAEMSQNGKLSPDDISMELIDAEISEITSQPSATNREVSNGTTTSPYMVKPEPDLLLIFGPYVKLDGYPPWQIRLTEIYCTGDKSSGMTGAAEAVEYQEFLRGLCRYARAQMRFGR
ncbi:hypothetical protein VTN00DRAFT_2441 [Thermoascus crustaceus]|uniref:uncharacterized protein n=1 Tax=Thermoascus crustaceus TaxID=5088 RepID=UPI00374218B8